MATWGLASAVLPRLAVHGAPAQVTPVFTVSRRGRAMIGSSPCREGARICQNLPDVAWSLTGECPHPFVHRDAAHALPIQAAAFLDSAQLPPIA